MYTLLKNSARLRSITLKIPASKVCQKRGRRHQSHRERLSLLCSFLQRLQRTGGSRRAGQRDLFIY